VLRPTDFARFVVFLDSLGYDRRDDRGGKLGSKEFMVTSVVGSTTIALEGAQGVVEFAFDAGGKASAHEVYVWP
jgi:hypothetical protein